LDQGRFISRHVMAAIFLQTTAKDLFMKANYLFFKPAWVALALVLMFTACSNPAGNGDDAFKGTWVSTGPNAIRIEASNGSLKEYLVSNNKEVLRGTYTVSGNTVTAKITQVNTAMFGGADQWVAWANLSSEYKESVGGSETQQLTITGNTFTSNEMTFTKAN
jgi:hypothetical protein